MSKKIWAGILAAAVMLALIIHPGTARAGSLDVTASSNAVTVGDTVTVTLVVKGEHIAAAEGAFSYDASLLSFISGDGGVSDGRISLLSAEQGGASSLTATIRFAATGAGNAEVRVSLDTVLDYNEQPLGAAEAGVSIAITAKGGQTTETPSSGTDYSLTGVAAENVSGADAPMYIWRVLTRLTLPSGFADRQIDYHGEYVGGAAIPDSEDLLLLYLSEASGENGGYYIYDEEKDTLFPYLTMASVSATYTLLWPDDSVTAPDGFEPVTITWKEQEWPAWRAAGGDEAFCLVYARNSSGERGFFVYSVADESVQRYVAAPETAPEATPSPSAKPGDKPASALPGEADFFSNPVVLLSLCAACAVFFALTVTFAALYAKSSRAQRKAARMQKRLRKSPALRDAPRPETAEPQAQPEAVQDAPPQDDIQTPDAAPPDDSGDIPAQ